MTTENQQITPADAGIVTSGTGTKGPEERALPDSLKHDMDLCLQIVREVLGEFDPKLLETFDTVRQYVADASAEHFTSVHTGPSEGQRELDKAV